MNPNGAIIVQSNMEIMVEVDAPTYEAARDAIAPFTELVKSPEHLHTYKISPLSLWRLVPSACGTPLRRAFVHRKFWNVSKARAASRFLKP